MKLKSIIVILTLIFFGSVFFGVFGTDLIKKYELVRAKSLLHDGYSKKVFDSAVKFYLNNDLNVEHQYASYYEFDNPFVKEKEYDTVLDLGVSADVRLTYLMLDNVGLEGRVIGVEANPKVIDIINKKLASYPNFKLYNYAVWSENGKGVFGLGDDPDKELNLDARLISAVDDKFKVKNTVEVELITIDNLVKNENIGKVDLIKSDIEGAELPALKGAVNTIKRYKPQLILSCHRKDDFYKLILFINSLHLGYHFYLSEFYFEPDKSLPEQNNFRNYIVYATVKNPEEINEHKKDG